MACACPPNKNWKPALNRSFQFWFGRLPLNLNGRVGPKRLLQKIPEGHKPEFYSCSSRACEMSPHYALLHVALAGSRTREKQTAAIPHHPLVLQMILQGRGPKRWSSSMICVWISLNQLPTKVYLLVRLRKRVGSHKEESYMNWGCCSSNHSHRNVLWQSKQTCYLRPSWEVEKLASGFRYCDWSPKPALLCLLSIKSIGLIYL